MDSNSIMALKKMILPEDVKRIIKGRESSVIVPESRSQLLELSMGNREPGQDNDVYEIGYEVAGKGFVKEASVTRCKNGVVVNYADMYMRRRDPDSMVIADDLPTDKPTHKERFGVDFDGIRKEAFDWLKGEELIIMPFMSGGDNIGLGYESVLVAPVNAAVFALALADLQGFVPAGKVPDFFKPCAAVYVAPPFRHTNYGGKQVVIHNRAYSLHEVFSFNLYPGPSAKKGIYAVLLDIGEQGHNKWITAHASTVRVVTPYELSLVIMHEGASGGGKSEMLEKLVHEPDGRLLLSENIITGEKTLISMADACELYPVTDDMAMCHFSLQNSSGKLVVADAENGWFWRVNHITEYGVAPHIEKSTIHPKRPLVFLNMECVPRSTCLIWEPIADGAGKPCPNPRVIMPRDFVENVVEGAVEVDVRSFGIRQPPTTMKHPNYGIAGLFHILPPALAWLWRLAAPRGFANPSIIDSEGMQSEGVGSYWPFATGKMVDQANLILEQIVKSPNTRYILVPNQYSGAYKIGFAGEMLTREFLARRGGVTYKREFLHESRCPLLGFVPESVKVDGNVLSRRYFHTQYQSELGEEAYDKGAKKLTDFFKEECAKYLAPELLPLGREIIEACLRDAGAWQYNELLHGY